MIEAKQRDRMAVLGLVLPLPVFVTLAYLLPFIGLATWSLRGQGGLSFDAYRALFGDPTFGVVLGRTLRIAMLTTAISIIVGALLAYVWAFAAPRVRLFVEVAILVPFWISVLVRAFAWLVLLGREGPVNSAVVAIGLAGEPLLLVRNEFAVVIGMVHYMIPYAVFPILAAMREVDPRLLLAAQSLGAGQGQRFWSVLLPLALPGVTAAAAIVFVFSLGFFVTPAILGGGRVMLMAEYIYIQIFQLADWSKGTAATVLLMVAVGLLYGGFAGGRRLMRRL